MLLLRNVWLYLCVSVLTFCVYGIHGNVSPQQRIRGPNVCGSKGKNCCRGWARSQSRSTCTTPTCDNQCGRGGLCVAPRKCRCSDGSIRNSCADFISRTHSQAVGTFSGKCSQSRGICQHYCRNIARNLFQCACKTGHRLLSNNRSCGLGGKTDWSQKSITIAQILPGSPMSPSIPHRQKRSINHDTISRQFPKRLNNLYMQYKPPLRNQKVVNQKDRPTYLSTVNKSLPDNIRNSQFPHITRNGFYGTSQTKDVPTTETAKRDGLVSFWFKDSTNKDNDHSDKQINTKDAYEDCKNCKNNKQIHSEKGHVQDENINEEDVQNTMSNSFKKSLFENKVLEFSIFSKDKKIGNEEIFKQKQNHQDLQKSEDLSNQYKFLNEKHMDDVKFLRKPTHDEVSPRNKFLYTDEENMKWMKHKESLEELLEKNKELRNQYNYVKTKKHNDAEFLRNPQPEAFFSEKQFLETDKTISKVKEITNTKENLLNTHSDKITKDTFPNFANAAGKNSDFDKISEEGKLWPLHEKIQEDLDFGLSLNNNKDPAKYLEQFIQEETNITDFVRHHGTKMQVPLLEYFKRLREIYNKMQLEGKLRNIKPKPIKYSNMEYFKSHTLDSRKSKSFKDQENKKVLNIENPQGKDPKSEYYNSGNSEPSFSEKREYTKIPNPPQKANKQPHFDVKQTMPKIESKSGYEHEEKNKELTKNKYFVIPTFSSKKQEYQVPKKPLPLLPDIPKVLKIIEEKTKQEIESNRKLQKTDSKNPEKFGKIEDEKQASFIKGDREKQTFMKADREKYKIEKAANEKEKIIKADVEKDKLNRADSEKEKIMKADAENEKNMKADTEKEKNGTADIEKENIMRAIMEKERTMKAVGENDKVIKADIEKDKVLKAENKKYKKTVKSDSERDKLTNADSEKYTFMKTGNEKDKIMKADNEKDKINKAESEKKRFLNTDIEKEKFTKADNEKDKIMKADNEKDKINKAESEKKRFLNTDIEKEKFTKADNEKDKIMKADNEKDKIMKAESEKKRFLNTDIEKGKFMKADNENPTFMIHDTGEHLKLMIAERDKYAKNADNKNNAKHMNAYNEKNAKYMNADKEKYEMYVNYDNGKHAKYLIPDYEKISKSMNVDKEKQAEYMNYDKENNAKYMNADSEKYDKYMNYENEKHTKYMNADNEEQAKYINFYKEKHAKY